MSGNVKKSPEKKPNVDEIISKLLTCTGLKIEEFAVKTGISLDALRKSIERNVLSKGSVEKIRDKFKVREDFLKDGIEPIMDEKPIHVQNGSENGKAIFFKELIENSTDYRLVHKTILDDYDMLPKKEIENRNKLIDVLTTATGQSRVDLIAKYEILIDALENKVKRIEGEKAQLQKDNDDLRGKIAGQN